MFTPTRFADALARALMSLIFILSGVGKIGAAAATQGYMEAFSVPGFLLWPTILFEVGAGLLLLVGLWTRPVAILLAGFSLLTAVIFHADFADQTQMVMFLKNVAMAGGFLMLAKWGSASFSIDGRREASQSPPGKDAS